VIGETISHYRILRHLGSGGMGDVYLAENLRLGLKVALKFLSAELSRDPAALRRFENEARAAAELSHPNIADIYDLEDADGHRFLVLEYLEGETLAQRIDRGPLPIADVLRIGRALAEGLAHAHARGIIHRDIKSANVMLTPEGGIKILDFGLARHVDATRVTRTGAMVGTVSYMSPEQVQGKEADARSDLWSLGIVLYECLTGRRPFEGESSAAIMHGIEAASPPPPTALRTGVPLELERVVLRCLDKDPALRYQHADDLAAELRRLDGSEHSATTATPATSPRIARRLAAAAGLLIALAVVVGLALRSGWIPGADRPPREPEVEPSIALVDVRDLSNPEDPLPSAMMTNLVEVGLIEASPCRVVSLEYLKDLRRRMFESVGPIESGQALEVARAAGATSLLLCDLAETAGSRSLLWRLVDTGSGEALGARRVEGIELADLADSAVSGVLPLLAQAAGVEVPPSASVQKLTTTSAEAYRHFTAATLALGDGRFEDATRELERAIEIDSTFALAHAEIAMHRTSMARAKEAAETAWALRDRLGIKDRLRLEAEIANLTGREGESHKTYREILRRWPDDCQAILDLLRVLSDNWQDEKEILTLAEHGVALYPDNEHLFRWLIISLRQTGRPEESTTAIRDRLHRIPEKARRPEQMAGFDRQIGDNFVALGQPDSAEVYFRRAADLDPMNFPAGPAIAMCSYMRGDVEQAIRTRERDLENPDIPPHRRADMTIGTSRDPGIAQLYAEIGRIEKAFQVMTEAEKRYPNDPVETSRNWLRLRIGRDVDVLQSIRSGAVRDVLRRPMMRAKALVALDSLDAAKGVVDSLLSFPGASDFWSAKAWLYFYLQEARAEIALAQGHPQEVLEFLESRRSRWLRLTMRDVDRLERLARAYRMMGRHDDAEATLRELLAFYGGHAVGHYHLGLLLEDRGRVDEAEAEYERFLAMWADADEGLPQLVDARRRLATLRGGGDRR